MFNRKTATAILAILLVLATVLTLASCSGGKFLKVGVDDSYPPMEYKDTDGKTTIGFDVDVAKELAKRMGYTSGAKFISNDWAGIFDALEAGKFNVIISSVSITTERKAAHSMTDPYVANRLVLVTTKENPKNVSTPVMIAGDIVVGCQTNTTAEDKLKELLASKTIINASQVQTYPTVTEPFDDLLAGRIDAVMVDIVVAKYYIKNNPDKFIQTWKNVVGEPIGMCFAKADTDLRDQANTFIKAMQDDGTLKTISNTWFGEDVVTNLK
jgi:polar amino acid transport system substrate-binding protein